MSTNTQSPIYITEIFFSNNITLTDETSSDICSSISKIQRLIQIILSNNILCIIYDYSLIEFHIYNNTLLFDTNIIHTYKFPTNLFDISNNMIQILIENIEFYNDITINKKIIPENISFDNILNKTCPNYSFNIYTIHNLQQIFNLPTNIINFKEISTNYYFPNYKFQENNLNKYHIFNYFKSILPTEYSYIFNEHIFYIIMKFL